MADHLAAIDMGRNEGGRCAPFHGGKMGPHLIQCGLGRGLPTYQLSSGILIHTAVWPQQIWAKKWGLCPLSLGGDGFPSYTMWHGPRPTSVANGILIHPRLATTDMGQKLGAVPPFLGSWVPIIHNVAWAEAYPYTKWQLNPSSTLTTTDLGRKLSFVVDDIRL